MRLYFAAPLFNEAERAFNVDLTAEIESLGIEVFLPQRDGIEGDRPPYDQLSREERRALMFTTDRDEILACDAFLFVTDGRVPDEGAAVELGLAYAHRHITGCSRLLVGLRTDTRAAFIAGPLNPMISQALDTVCESRTELLALLHHLVQQVDSETRVDLAGSGLIVSRDVAAAWDEQYQAGRYRREPPVRSPA